MSCNGTGQPGLNHRFCDDSFGHGLLAKIVRGARGWGPEKDHALIQMGNWSGVFIADTKD